MGNYATKNHVSYFDVRLVRDAKHFEASGDKPAATYLTFVHSVKGEDCDTFIDARVVRGAKLFSGLKKGDSMVVIHGELTFKTGKDDEVRGIIYDAQVVTKVNLKERAEETPLISNPDKATPTAETDLATAFD